MGSRVTSIPETGTGVSSLPYHHPFMLADRMVLLDHLTRGRAMFGVGPGALPSDAFMLGIDPLRQREMMDEALEAILALLTSDEPVTRETGWFTMRDARLQLRPFSRPHMEVAVAAQVSPAGPRAAGKYGVSLLSLGATTVGATLAVCRAAGIGFMGTGGIGGVHRGWAETLDISADLGELGRTEALVVASGAKSILDVPATAALRKFSTTDLADLCGISRLALVEGAATPKAHDLRGEPRCERSWKRDGTVKPRRDGSLLSDRDAAAVGLV